MNNEIKNYKMENNSINRVELLSISEIHPGPITNLFKIAHHLNTFLMAIGTINNMLCFFVFLNKNLRKRKFNWYLLTVAVFEFIFCLIGFSDYIFTKIHKRKIFLHDLDVTVYMILNYIIHTSDSCVTILTLLLSIDRLYAIKKPMKIREFVTNLHAKKTIGLSLLLLVLLKTLSFAICELDYNGKAFILFCSLISPFIFNTMPLVIVLIINGLLFKEIWYDRRKKSLYAKKLSSDTRSRECISVLNKGKKSNIEMRIFNKKETTKSQKSHYIVILVSSIWSILTTIPYYSFNTFYSLFRLNFFSSHFHMKTIQMIQVISSVLFNSNHCINFFIYLSFYSEFRKIIKNSFLKLFSK